MFRLILAGAVTPLFASARPTSAEPGPLAPASTARHVALRYSEPVGCPGQDEFVAAVNARVRLPINWNQLATATRIVVTIERRSEHAVGKLEIWEGSEESTRREFSAITCEEVSSALALVASLALDPNARTDPLPPRGALASQQDFPSLPPPPAAPPAPTLPPAAKPVPAPPPPPAVPQETEHRDRYAAWLGPSAGVSVGYAPEPLVNLGLWLGARLVRPELSPGLHLSILWGETGATGPSAASGSFAWALGRLEACPLQVRWGTLAALEPCLATEVGRLSARGADDEIVEPISAERWWVAGGATLSLHLHLGALFTRFAVLGLVPATRDEFVFRDPDRSIHRASPFVFGANLSLGFQFGM